MNDTAATREDVPAIDLSDRPCRLLAGIIPGKVIPKALGLGPVVLEPPKMSHVATTSKRCVVCREPFACGGMTANQVACSPECRRKHERRYDAAYRRAKRDKERQRPVHAEKSTS